MIAFSVTAPDAGKKLEDWHMAGIFLIEDDRSLREECTRLLVLNGYETSTCTDFSSAASEVLQADCDCVILDLKLPGADGLSICREIRAKSDVPIVVLTSSDSEFDEVMGINLGADDYLTKPYSPAVLLARVQSAIRRANPGAARMLERSGIHLDISRAEASFGEKTVELTRNEMRLLAALIRARGLIVSRQDLMYELWQSDAFIDDNTLSVNMNRLRKALTKIGVPEGTLKTHRGLGYSL